MAKRKAGFVEPMLLLRTDYLLDDGERWVKGALTQISYAGRPRDDVEA